VTYVKLSRSEKPAKKFKVKIGQKTIHFGARGMSDFTKNKDVARKQRYLSRHKARAKARRRENWGITGVLTAGFWSRWLLWNKPSLLSSKRDIQKRFNIIFT
jgi:hypothetical protein